MALIMTPMINDNGTGSNANDTHSNNAITQGRIGRVALSGRLRPSPPPLVGNRRAPARHEGAGPRSASRRTK